MGISNVFSKKQAALKFEKSAYIPSGKFQEIADMIVKECDLKSDEKVHILDVGSGTGRTILNILNRFFEKSIDFMLDDSEKTGRIRR